MFGVALTGPLKQDPLEPQQAAGGAQAYSRRRYRGVTWFNKFPSIDIPQKA